MSCTEGSELWKNYELQEHDGYCRLTTVVMEKLMIIIFQGWNFHTANKTFQMGGRVSLRKHV